MKRLPVLQGFLRRKLDVEPLADARWARVERAVLEASAVDRRRPVDGRSEAAPRWKLAAAMLVLAGALAAIAGGLAWRAVLPEAREGATRVETAANGSRVEFGDSTIDVGPTSAVRLSGDASHGVVLTLDRGSVECDVVPRRERPPYLVEAGSVEVRVVGTHFTVVRNGDAVAVEVQRGQVEVTSGGERVLVPAGSQWPPAPRETPPSPAADPPPALAPRDPAAGHGAPESRAPESHASASARAAASGSPRDQYEAASRLEAAQPDAAIALYRDLARQGGSWGANALFAAGRLEADRGSVDDARRMLRDYIAHYPAGPNVDDARHLLERLR